MANIATDCDLVSEQGHLFTPYLSYGNKIRAYMELSDDDNAKFEALEKGQSVEVTDQLSGVEVLVAKASCGIKNCYCPGKIISPIRW